jgi:ABC-type transport system involved in multi-copper enzyme maturation permease subunit
MKSSQFVPLLRNEVAKAVRRKLPYFGILAVGLLCVIIYFVSGRLSDTATANAWGYVGFSMQLVFSDIGPIFIIVFAAMLLAEETGTGTIRAALAAPVHRWELYLAKAVTGLLYMIALSAAALLFSAALAKIHYHFGVVGDSLGLVYSRKQAMQALLVAHALSWIPLSALVMYGLLISTMIRSPGAAVAVGISTLFLIDFTKHLVGLLFLADPPANRSGNGLSMASGSVEDDRVVRSVRPRHLRRGPDPFYKTRSQPLVRPETKGIQLLGKTYQVTGRA